MPPQLCKPLPGVSGTMRASRRGTANDPGTCDPDKRLTGAGEATAVTICTGCTGGLSVRARADDIRRTTGSGIAGSSMDRLAVSWLVVLVSLACRTQLWPSTRVSLNWLQPSSLACSSDSDGLRSSPSLGCCLDSLDCHGRCTSENRGCGISLDVRDCLLASSSRWLLLEAAS